MTVARTQKGKFSAERLFRPASIVVVGAGTPDGNRVLTNILEGGFAGRVMAVGPMPPQRANAVEAYASVAELPGGDEAADLAVVAGPEDTSADALRRLAARGTRAAVVIDQFASLTAVAAAAEIRVLGASSFGIAIPRLGLNASMAHIEVPAGRVALLTQSASMARAVLDWAAPNGVGFSHIVGIGGNADIGFGLVLDYLSRDPGTGLILLDIRRIRAPRAFISAARAASRLRPVVAIRPGGRLADPTGRSDAVFAAALHRAGVFLVSHMEEFLAAAETLTRARPARGEGLAVVTNAIGPGRLAADAALQAGIKLVRLPPDAQSVLAASLPAELLDGLIYAGAHDPIQVAEMAAMVSAVPEVGGVLALLAPTGPADRSAIEAVIAAAAAARLPVLSCVMGETTGSAHRRRLAEAGLPAFATPEQAVHGFGHLLRDRRARLDARELPPSQVLEVVPDREAAGQVIATARAARRDALSREESVRLLAAYGIATGSAAAPAAATASGGGVAAAIRVHDDAVLGPAIGLTAGPAAGFAYDLPPLNLPLARALAGRAGLRGAGEGAVAGVLVRVSQLLVDWPDIGALGIDPLVVDDEAAYAVDAAVWLRPPGLPGVLAISPYPEHLAEIWQAAGERFRIRPIRPEDAEAHGAMVRRVPQEDIRYRFFTAMREVSAEQMVRLTQIDYDREMAFIAIRLRDGATVGVSRLVREPDMTRGEFAVLVEPSAKGIGLASHLMHRLIEWARARGMRRITGQILADNHAMIAFVGHLGFAVHRAADEPDVVEARLNLV